MNRRGSTLIVVLLIIAGFLAVVGIWYYKSYRQTSQAAVAGIPIAQTPVQTSTTLDTSGWKTYVSPPSGFSFQYPNTWTDESPDNDLGDSFGTASDTEILGLGYFNNEGNSLLEYAQDNIQQICGNGTSSHVISTVNSGVLYVLSCNEKNEYRYIFVMPGNSNGNIDVLLDYIDDSGGDTTESQQTMIFNAIINTIEATDTVVNVPLPE